MNIEFEIHHQYFSESDIKTYYIVWRKDNDMIWHSTAHLLLNLNYYQYNLIIERYGARYVGESIYAFQNRKQARKFINEFIIPHYIMNQLIS